MRQRNIVFPCGKLVLEGICCYPDGKGTFPAVVLCHPHPLYGGSMNNNVILALSSTFTNSSLISLMFNFRGVGKSDGNFGGGIAEQEDVAAAVNWLTSQPEVDAGKIGLAGYSFGASVASSVACNDKRIKAMTLISPPLETYQIDQLKQCTKPKLIISGSADELIPPDNVDLLFREAAEPKQLELIPGADHFLVGYETVIAATAADFMLTSLKSARY